MLLSVFSTHMDTLQHLHWMVVFLGLLVRGTKEDEQSSPAMSLDSTAAPSCPLNSAFNTCASACPATCLEPNSPGTCPFPCVQGCTCLSGFVLHNRTCIPRKQCECWHEGKAHLVGSGFWADASCTRKCTCPGHGGPVVCKEASCPKGTQCGVKDGDLGCHPKARGVCRVHGDPHYITFDQHTHHFQGNCTYILARVGPTASPLPRFIVAAKNQNQGWPARSFVHKVFVEVYGELIEIHKGNEFQVMVNEMWKTLPVRNANGSVMVSRSGSHISIETDFGLMVSYDGNQLAEVWMPAAFANLTRGLCGNFNGIKEDDDMMPNGQQAANSTMLGRSWRMSQGKYDHPFCSTPDTQSLCTSVEEDTYREADLCGLLTKAEGPFRKCHTTVNPESWFNTCLRDMCAFKGDHKFLCNVLVAYSEACQKFGILLNNWRTETYCLFLCPSNSEYHMCTSACQATCANPLAPRNCSKPCVEGCQCHKGYLFSAGECVLATDCGCLDEGRYYEKGETFWRSGCNGQCLCAENGTLVCNNARCPEDQICKVEEGFQGCSIPDKASCHIFGDYHAIAFDGKLYHFCGGCNYTVVETFGEFIQHFSVMVKSESPEKPQAMRALTSVAFSYKDLHIVLGKGKEVSVNGVKVSIPRKLDHEIFLEERWKFVAISSSFGLRIEFDGSQNLFIQVNGKYKARVRGLCSPPSGNRSEALTLSKGHPEEEEEEADAFANHWMVMDGGGRCGPQGTSQAKCSSDSKKRHQGICSAMSESGGPFRPCHAQVLPSHYVASCLQDLCASKGDKQRCRQSMEAYVAVCGHFGINLGDWWNKSLCEPVVPCNFSCSFDKDLCLWTQSASDNFDWTWFQGSTPSEMTGPNQDHTSGGGHYLYTEGDNVIEGNLAHLVSPVCNPSGPFCFSFWFHMYGSASLMSLRVYVAPEGKPSSLVWVATGRKQNAWLPARVTIRSTGPLKIIMEGVRGEDFHSDVAMDDISVTEGNCTAPSPEEPNRDEKDREEEEEVLPGLLADLFQKQRSEFQADLAAALEPIKAQLASLAKEKVEDSTEKDLDTRREMTQLQNNSVHFQNEKEGGKHQHLKVGIAFHGTSDEAQEGILVTSLVGFLNQICPEVHVSERDFERVSKSPVPTLRDMPRGEYGNTEITEYHGFSIRKWRKRRMLQLHQERDAGHRQDLPFRLLVRLNGRTFWASSDHEVDICNALKAVKEDHNMS